MSGNVEYRVVWRWHERDWPDALTRERHGTYKTLAGAERLLRKLRSNGGRYDQYINTEPTRYDDGLTVVHLILDYSRLEWREVGHWRLHESEMPE
jgi:hypothetical protein